MRKALVLLCGLLLAGCSEADWNHALNYTGLGNEEAPARAARPQPTAAAQPAAAEPAVEAASPPEAPNTDFCRSVATQDATGNDFDPATQQRVFARSYAQCMLIYTR